MNKRIKKRIISIFLIGSVCIGLYGCGKEPKKVDEPQNLAANATEIQVDGKAVDEAFVESMADFSVNLFKESYKAKEEDKINYLISPESVMLAMAMATNGAGGETRKEMEQVLGGTLSIEDLNRYLYTYAGKHGDSEQVEFNIANSIWLKDEEGLEVQKEFLSAVNSYYDGEVYKEAFDDETVAKINQWVDTKTNGMIKKLLEKIEKDMVMYIINAIAFEAEWKEEYKDSQINEDGKFTNYQGKEETVNMMHSGENIYICDDNAQGFIKPYKGGEYGFMAILPNEGISVDEYISDMTGDDYISLFENRSFPDVYVDMPEFTYEYEMDLKEVFGTLGVKKAIAEGADFTNMFPEGGVYIDTILHKTYIEVNRQGTKAAAVTAVGMKTESAMEVTEIKYVILDRPFIYAIVDMENGLPVFMGVVNSIAK